MKRIDWRLVSICIIAMAIAALTAVAITTDLIGAASTGRITGRFDRV